MSFLAAARADPRLSEKAAFFEDFWKGEGPCPILFAKPHLALGKNYDRWNLREQHEDPEKLLVEALGQVEDARSRPDDGIPLVRADLGTTLFPSALGLRLAVGEELHPSLAEHLDLASYAKGSDAPRDFDHAGEFAQATSMYRLFARWKAAGRIPNDVMAYLPDNQGIFDLSHLAVGTDIFYGFADDPEAVMAAQERSLSLFLEGSLYFKALLGEERDSMLHGHGMASGVWFPDTGIRISEDSCTLLSSSDIRRFCLPFIERAIKPFGRGFLHFCGKHEDFLAMACENPLVSTINLGNPESYDLGEVFRLCGRTGTVYFGHLPRADGLGDEDWLEGIAELALRSACRLILVAPGLGDAPACRTRWHGLTRPSWRR